MAYPFYYHTSVVLSVLIGMCSCLSVCPSVTW